MKICTKCKDTLDLGCFGKHKITKDGLSHECKSCKKAVGKKYFQENKQRIMARTMRWEEDNRESHLQNKREWKKRNITKVNSDVAKRRAQKMSNGVATDSLEKQMIEGLYFISRVLGKSCGEAFHVDHIHPISKGGTHTFNNLQILSAEENLAKGAKV